MDPKVKELLQTEFPLNRAQNNVVFCIFDSNKSVMSTEMGWMRLFHLFIGSRIPPTDENNPKTLEINLIDFLAETGFGMSKSDIRRLMKQNGLKIGHPSDGWTPLTEQNCTVILREDDVLTIHRSWTKWIMICL